MSKAKAKSKAIELLENLKINKLPINVNKIADSLGIEVVYKDLPDEVSGILYPQNIQDSRYTVVINNSHHLNRQRFSIAHELGHFYLNHSTEIHVDKQTFFRDNRSSIAIDPIEIEANTFAAEILMPEEIISEEFEHIIERKTDLDEDKIVNDLANTFEVSSVAMTYRLRNLELLF